MRNEQPNRILEFLTAPARPEGEASRGNRRRRSTARVQLSWAEGDDGRSIRGRLRNISRGGAALVAIQPPPVGARARLRLVEGEGTPWIEVEILAADPDARGRRKIRLRFLEPCPSFLLRLAILGSDPADEEVPAAPPEWVSWNPLPTE